MVARKSSIQFTGPFFERDPHLTLRKNILRYMDRIAQVGEDSVRSAYEAGGAQGQATVPYVRGRTVSIHGARWKTTAVISVNPGNASKPEAVRIMAIAAGRHQGIHGTTSGAEGETHGIRNVKQALTRAAREAAAVLTEGMN